MARTTCKHLARRLAALLVVAVAASGCGWTVESNSGDDDSSKEAGPAHSPAPTAPAGSFDECGVLTRAELGARFGITARSATPEGKGWRLECDYAADGVVGLGVGDVSVVIDTEAEGTFFTSRPKLITAEDGSPLPHAVAETVPGLGDESYVLLNYNTRTSGEIFSDSVQVGFRSGTYDVRLMYQTYRSKPTIESTIGLARKIAARLPAKPEVPARLVSGPCAKVDLRPAVEVLGQELPGARQVVGESGHLVNCDFTGRHAGLSVSIDSRAAAITEFDAKSRVAKPVPGVGDRAFRLFDTYPLTTAEIKLGKQVVSVDGWRQDGQDVTKADADRVLRSIADSLR